MGQQLAVPRRGITLLGMPIDSLDEASCVELVMSSLARGAGGWILTCNVDILRRYVSDPGFRALASGVSLVVADGMPLLWASSLQGTPLPQRVAGSNLIYTACAAAARRGHSVFLLGGDPGTAEAAGAILCQRYPGLKLAGTFCPPLGFESVPQQMAAIREAVVRAAPDIVFVALGCPKQEQLINAVRTALPNTWWIGVGISFSFVCGRVRRAPHWVQRFGLEWAHRLVQEPKRLARRYLVHGIPFAIYLMCKSAAARVRPPRQPALR